MNIRNLIQLGLLGTALAIAAGAQPQPQPQYQGRAERHDLQRDTRRRDQFARKVEADRRAVEHERHELRHSNWYAAGHESRELRKAQERLDRDSAQLRVLDADLARDTNRWR